MDICRPRVSPHFPKRKPYPASSAWDRIFPSGTGAVDLSPEEYFRFYHVFYRIEFIYTIFRHRALLAETYPWFFGLP